MRKLATWVTAGCVMTGCMGAEPGSGFESPGTGDAVEVFAGSRPELSLPFSERRSDTNPALCTDPGVYAPFLATTTLAEQLGANTSAARGWMGAANVSKQSIRSLVDPSPGTLLLAKLVLRLGLPGQLDVGYSSADESRLAMQLVDMQSRGLDGAIVKWSNPLDDASRLATAALMREAELRKGAFVVALQIERDDVLALGDVDLTEAVVSLLLEADPHLKSPAYAQLDGQPMVLLQDLLGLAVDWDAVRIKVPGVALIHGGKDAFREPFDGAFSGVPLTSSAASWGESELNAFYQEASLHPTAKVIGSAYPSYSDEGLNPVTPSAIGANCGQTWLSTLQQLHRTGFDRSRLGSLQIYSWNDYEHGTAIEPGIDGCFQVIVDPTEDRLTWALSGRLANVHHLNVFVSRGGEQLMKVAQLDATARELDIASLNLPPGQYEGYVQAVGQASLMNQLSAPMRFAVEGPCN